MELFERIRYISNIKDTSLAKIANFLKIQPQTFHKWLDAKSQRNLWEHLPKVQEMFPDVRKEWLWWGEGEMIGHPMPVADAVLAQALPTPAIDKEVLKDVVRILEEMLVEAGKTLPPDAKAEVICQLYQLVLEEEGKTQPGKPARMFRLISKAMAG